MSTIKVSQKILAPILAPTILHREQLSLVLGEALGSSNDAEAPSPYDLVLLCAPAGYGKTILLADTMRHLSLTCCWCFLDRYDLERVTFLETLLASIRRCFPSFGPQLDSLLAQIIEQDEIFFQALLDVLIDTLATDIPKTWVLALCNYQTVNSSEAINRIVSQILKRLPPRCRLVIESRALPDLELAPLIAKGKMCRLSSNALKFSVQDLCDLAQVLNLPAFSKEEAVQLATAFDGWITGILLGSRFGSAQFEQFTSTHGSNWATPAMYANRQQLFAFVVKEVFRTEPTIYTFLKDTSLLDQMTPAFCDAFLETSNAAALLERAERQGLFVICTGEARKLVYVCHPILRELFREELRCHDSERYCTLHQQIATLFYQMHEYETALNHALEAQEYNLTIRIMIEAAPMFFNQEQDETMLRYLERLPPHVALKIPQLLLIRVNADLERGNCAHARMFLDFAEAEVLVTSSLSTREKTENALIHTELAIVRGKFFLHQGEHQLAQKQFRLALELLPVDRCVLRIRAHQYLGICIILGGGTVHEGIVQFQKALQLCHPRIDQRLTGNLHHQLAYAYELAGNYIVAEHHRQCIDAIQDRLGQAHSIINNLTGIGFLKIRQGFVEEAETSFHTILSLTHQSSRFLSSEAYALLGLGELELTRQCFKQALMRLEEALSLAHQLEDRYLLNGTLNALALVYLKMEDIYTAQCMLDQTVLRVNETQSYEGIAYTLVKGTILLAQQHYDEANATFEEVVRLTDITEIQLLHVQALTRRAFCFLVKGQRSQAKKNLLQVVAINTKGDYDYSLQVEFQTFPVLQLLMQEIVEQSKPLDMKMLPMERLSIYALGEPNVLIDTMPVMRWRMARAMELYFFLLESNQPLHKDQIITALWPEADDIERINQTFRSTTYYLRQAIGDACLVQRSGLYWLDLKAVYGQFWYDVAAFEEQQRIGNAALEEDDDESATQAFQKMVNLYHGDYVQAFYNDWCIRRRDELRKACMEAHQQLAHISWHQEIWGESLLHWQHLLALDPYMEQAHYGIMRCYLRQGKRSLALQQYQRCKQELQEQLHVQPGRTLQKLYQRLTSTST